MPATAGLEKRGRRTGVDAGPLLTGWLAATACGDRVAFQQLYDATSARLFGIALGLMRRREDAEDVLQDAYLRIWTRAEQYRAERGDPGSWLAQIVRNAATDRLRRNRQACDDIAAHEGELTAPSSVTSERLEILRCLALLEPKQREAVLLAYLRGYTNEELARHFGIPLGTGKSWLRRSLMTIQAHFAEDLRRSA